MSEYHISSNWIKTQRNKSIAWNLVGYPILAALMIMGSGGDNGLPIEAAYLISALLFSWLTYGNVKGYLALKKSSLNSCLKFVPEGNEWVYSSNNMTIAFPVEQITYLRYRQRGKKVVKAVLKGIENSGRIECFENLDQLIAELRAQLGDEKVRAFRFYERES